PGSSWAWCGLMDTLLRRSGVPVCSHSGPSAPAVRCLHLQMPYTRLGGADGGQANRNLNKKPQPRDENRLARRSPFLMSPFALLQQFFNDEILGNAPARAWSPKIDVVQRGNELVIRADLPGVNPDEVVVEVGDRAVTVSGERRQEREEEE